jgi:lysine-specific demethylase PHF8
VGTKLFVEELSKRFFSASDDIIMMVSGKQLTLPYLNQCGFNSPILVTDKEGLSMSLPQLPFTVHDIVDALGPDFLLDVIDVQRQKSVQMTLEQFAETFTSGGSDRVLNCLSLEVSNTVLSEIISPPLVARKLCWVNNVWPSSNTINQTRPQVQKYVIMSMKDSHTDFHIDFGGTSV